MSIWKGIKKTRFEHGIAILARSEAHQDVARLHAEYASPSQLNSILPDDFISEMTESQLALDFAFLAAQNNSPISVAAATVQCTTDPKGITISIAANRGIKTPVVTAFRRMIAALMACAMKDPTKATMELCWKECLAASVQLHRDRILSRLGSRKARNQSNKKVWDGLAARLQRLTRVDLDRSRQAASRPSIMLSSQAEELSATIQYAETCEPGSAEELDALQAVVVIAYNIWSMNEPLTERARDLGFDKSFTPRIIYRQIQAIGNYTRICHHLCKVATRYRQWFNNIALNVIRTDPWVNKTRPYVHAEIQLLLNHESSMSKYGPRCIAASQQACFLCYCFIRVHAKYTVLGSHGQVYPWTVNDIPKMGDGSRNRLHRALQKTDAEVRSALRHSAGSPRRHSSLPMPFHFVLRRMKDRLWSPPMSTIRSRVGHHYSPLSEKNDSVPTPGSADGSQNGELRVAKSLLIYEGKDTTADRKDVAMVREVSDKHPARIRAQGLELFVHLEESDGDQYGRHDASLETYFPDQKTAYCRLRPGLPPWPDRKLQRVTAAQLWKGEVTLRIDEMGKQLDFILESENGSEFLIEFGWP